MSLDVNRGRFDEAVAIINHRRGQDSPLKRAMADIADRYNGDYTIPLPDVQGEPEFPVLGASILADAIDSSATRANDTNPNLLAPAVRPDMKSHLERANTRRRAWAANWAHSKLPLKLARTYRQLFGYGTYAFAVTPNFRDGYPDIGTRDPLITYPEPMSVDEIRTPLNCGFVYGRSPAWLRHAYPEARALIDRHSSDDDDLWDVLEWVDENWLFIGIMGKRRPDNWGQRWNADGSRAYTYAGMDGPMISPLLLRAFPNRAGLVPVVCPNTVTLDRPISGLDRIVPIVDLMNKLAALDFIAAEKGVFPDRYAVAGPAGGTPTIVGGTWNDGRTGKMNLLENVASVGELQTAPGPMTQALLSMLERNARVSSGNPAVFQGEMSGSVRSGQTLTQLGSFAVDPRIKEAHTIMAYALEVVNEAVAAVSLGYFPSKRCFLFSGWAGDNAHVDYTPADIWAETKQSVVKYPMPGMDQQTATIALGQANGAKFMSRRTARNLHPLIDDPATEEQQLVEETLEDAIQVAVLQLVSSGGMAFTDLVALKDKIKRMPLEAAVAELQKEAQERQAREAQMPADAPPELAAPPGAQPGLNMPGAGGEEMSPEKINQSANRAATLNSLLTMMRRPPSGGSVGPDGGPPALPAGGRSGGY